MSNTSTDTQMQAVVQRGWDDLARGDRSTALSTMADDVILENGPLPLAERWLEVRGRDSVEQTLATFDAMFSGGLQQVGRCVYADSRVALSIARDRAVLRDGEPYEADIAVVMRFDADQRVDRLWFVELDDVSVARLFSSLGATS